MAPAKRKPKLGQHFLEDPRVLEGIAGALRLRSGEAVIEIGPGQGALTSHLLDTGAAVTAIEVDPRLVQILRTRSEESPALEVLHADILDLDLGQVIADRAGGRVAVAGNLPYYITSPILRKVFAAAPRISRCVFLIQKEVALRLVARAGSRDYGYLTALSRLYCEPELLFTVPASAFRPPPEVTSAVVRLTISETDPPEASLLEFLKACFAHPRKTLLNNLSGRHKRSLLAALPEMARRAQELGLDELQALHGRLRAMPR